MIQSVKEAKANEDLRVVDVQRRAVSTAGMFDRFETFIYLFFLGSGGGGGGRRGGRGGYVAAIFSSAVPFLTWNLE